MGWKYQGVVHKLEGKRKVKSGVFYERKKEVEVREIRKFFAILKFVDYSGCDAKL
jgi:hypothetical protein